MNEYLFLFRGGDTKQMEWSAESSQAYMQRWMDWMQNLAEQGKLTGAQPLASTGKQIKGTKKVVTDGPFIEGKEMVGGYLLCKSDSYDQALSDAMGCPILEFDDGVVEVREISALKM